MPVLCLTERYSFTQIDSKVFQLSANSLRRLPLSEAVEDTVDEEEDATVVAEEEEDEATVAAEEEEEVEEDAVEEETMVGQQ